MKIKSSRVLLFLVLFTTSIRMNAAVVLNDTFTDLGRTNGTDADDSQWYVLSNQTVTSVNATTGKLIIGSSGAGADSNPHAVTTFSGQTLNVGQTITLSFDFNSSSTTAATTGIRFGLYNSGGTNLSADLFAATPATGTIFQNDLGYSVFAPHLGSNGNQPIGFYSRPTNATSNSTQLAGAANTLVNNSTNLATATNSTSTYSASLSLTRTSTGFDYGVSYAGTSFSGTSTTALNTTTFDTLSIFGTEKQNQYLTIDNVNITVVPEPTAAVLSAIGLLGLLTRRRR